MDEYIYIPDEIIRNLNNSYLLIKFKEDSKFIIEGNKIDLNYLRKFYKVVEIGMFNNLVRELTLRGARFIYEKGKFLPKKYVQSFNKRIKIINDSNNFREISFSSYGLSTIIDSFKIKSDLFFNGIPLDGFELLISDIDILELEKEFARNNFLIENKKNKLGNDNLFFKTEEEKKVFYKKLGNLIELTPSEEVIKSYFLSLKHNNSKLINEELLCLKSIGQKKIELFYEKLKSSNEILENKIIFKNTIKYYFKGPTYRVFREYCLSKDITCFYEINEMVMVYFKKNSTTQQFKKAYSYCEKLKQKLELKELEEEKKQEEKIYNEKLMAKNLFISQKTIDFYTDQIMPELESFKLSELKEKTFTEISEEYNISINKLFELNYKLLNYKTLEEICLLKSSEDLEVLKMKYIENLTLEKIGERLKITRQGVSSILKKNQYFFLKYKKIIDLFFNINFNKNNFTIDEVKCLISPKFYFVVDILKENKFTDYKYSEVLKKFSLIEINKEKLLEELNDIIWLREIDKTEEILKNFEIFENCEKILVNLEYKKLGEYYIKKNKTMYKKEEYELIFKNHIKAPFKFKDENGNEFKKLYSKYLGKKEESNSRAIESRLNDVKEIIRVSHRTFLHIDYLGINSNEFKEIEEELLKRKALYLENKRNKEKSFVNTEELFEKYGEEIHLNIKINKDIIYSILKYFCEGEYKFGGNNYTIYFDEVKTREELVLELLKEKEFLNKKEIINKLKWPVLRLEDTICKSKRLFYNENNEVIDTDKIKLSKEILEKFKKLINGLFTKSYLTMDLIEMEVKFNEELTNEIGESSLEMIILKYFDSEYKFISRTKILVNNENNCNKIEDIVRQELKESFKREDIKALYKDFGYKEASIYLATNNLLNKNIIISLNRDRFIFKEKFYLDINEKNRIIEFVEKEFKDSQYLNLENIDLSKLGRTNFDKSYKIKYYNQFLIGEILKDVYVRIDSNSLDYRYNKVILSKNKDIRTFNDLIYFILKNEYKGNMIQYKIYDYLIEKNMLYKTEKSIFSKKLPDTVLEDKRFKLNENYIEFN